MQTFFSLLIGKTIRALLSVKGGGSALPGLIVEWIDPHFLKRTIGSLPHGVVVISGTNGKTTTTKMVVEMLESQGLTVLSNKTGSNFVRGTIAALITQLPLLKKTTADIAVFELDEAHAVHFVKKLPPTYCLLLNVLRDQLDRFGEINTTARLLHTIAQHTTKGIVVNADDPLLNTPSQYADSTSARFTSYHVHPSLRSQFPTDNELHEGKTTNTSHLQADSTELTQFNATSATFTYDKQSFTSDIQLKGIYNLQNATGAIALVRLICGDELDQPALHAALGSIKPAFGRGETIHHDGTDIELYLVKNPSGFRLSLASSDNKNTPVMIAINDDYADGRDMSWLWDVDFTGLPNSIATTTGTRAHDMTLRLQYDDITVQQTDPDISTALSHFIDNTDASTKRIYCTYTAMLAIRKQLSKQTEVEKIQ